MARQPAPSSNPSGQAPRKAAPQAVNIGGETIAERIMPHLKKIIAVMVVVGLVLGAVFFMRWRKEQARQKTSAKAAGLLEVLARNVEKPEPPPEAAGSGSAAAPAAVPDADADADAEPTFASIAARGDTGTTEITSRGVAGLVGDAVRGSLLLDAGKFDDALAAFQAGAKASGLDGVVAREGVGLAYEAKALATTDAAAKQALLIQALEAFRAEQPDAAGPRRDYALYHQGRILATMDKRADAIKAFEDALAVDDTDLTGTLKNRLAELEAGA